MYDNSKRHILCNQTYAGSVIIGKLIEISFRGNTKTFIRSCEPAAIRSSNVLNYLSHAISSGVSQNINVRGPPKVGLIELLSKLESG